jgi:septal ring factor EnvC (AmiA/AmiB activator)
MSQLDRISAQTNCWLFIGGQHSNAGSQFIHYTSPRLRKDAKQDAQRLTNQFNFIVNGLMHARRKDALELGKTLAESRQETAVVREQMRAAQKALADREEELQRKIAEIAEIKARLERRDSEE